MFNGRTELDIKEMLEQLGISYERYLQWNKVERTYEFPIKRQELHRTEDKPITAQNG